MKESIIGLIGAGILGFFSGLFLPWVKWAIEKRQKRYEYRKELITTWKQKVETANFDSPEGQSNFGNSSAYSSLRSHMAEEVVVKFEQERTVYAAGGRGGDVRKQMLLDEVARLEKKWGLF